MAHLLDGQAITKLMTRTAPQGYKPVLQALQVRSVQANAPNAPLRYRMVASDGVRSAVLMLGSQLNDLCVRNELQQNTFFSLDAFQTSELPKNNRTLVVCINLSIIGQGDAVVGNPTPYDAPEGAGQQQPMQQQPMQPMQQQPMQPMQQQGYGAAYGSAPMQQPMQQPMMQQQQQQQQQQYHQQQPMPMVKSDPMMGQQSMYGAAAAASSAQVPGTGAGAGYGMHVAAADSIADLPPVVPIRQLNPFVPKWTIKVRVTNKRPVRTYQNARGAGKLMSVDLLDADKTEIRATMFNETVDKFNDVLVVGSSYYISGGQLKKADQRFNSLNSGLEITFGRETIVRSAGNASEIAQISFNFVPFSQIEGMDRAAPPFDVLGVLLQAEEVVTVSGKTSGNPMARRNIYLGDASGKKVQVTMWFEIATVYDLQKLEADHPVVAIKSVRLGEYQGVKQLGTIANSQIQIHPDVPEAAQLAAWYASQGAFANFSTIGGGAGGAGGPGAATLDPPAQRTTLGAANEVPLSADKPHTYTVRAMLQFIRADANVMYQACTKCNKKVVGDASSSYHCEKCDVRMTEPAWRFMLSAQVADATGAQWMTVFNDVAEQMLGTTAAELAGLQQSDPKAFESVFERALFKSYVIKLRTRSEMYNNEARRRTTCVTAAPVDFVAECKWMMSQLAV